MSATIPAIIGLIIALPIICAANFLIALYFHKRICRDRGWRTNWKGDVIGYLDDQEA